MAGEGYAPIEPVVENAVLHLSADTRSSVQVHFRNGQSTVLFGAAESKPARPAAR